MRQKTKDRDDSARGPRGSFLFFLFPSPLPFSISSSWEKTEWGGEGKTRGRRGDPRGRRRESRRFSARFFQDRFFFKPILPVPFLFFFSSRFCVLIFASLRRRAWTENKKRKQGTGPMCRRSWAVVKDPQPITASPALQGDHMGEGSQLLPTGWVFTSLWTGDLCHLHRFLDIIDH